MQNYRDLFPGKPITPKMHILENHCLPFIQNFGFGLGLLAEQGGEHIHAQMVQFSKRMAGIRNPVKRLKSTVQASHANNATELRKFIPVKKERNLKRKTKP